MGDFSELGYLLAHCPATGGISAVTIGPVGIGLSATGTGDTTYSAHLLNDHAWIDWDTSNTRAGFFFDTGRIHIKGTLIANSNQGSAELYTDNKMRFSGYSSILPSLIITNADKLMRETKIHHGVTIQCVPAAGALILGSIGLSCSGWLLRRCR